MCFSGLHLTHGRLSITTIYLLKKKYKKGKTAADIFTQFKRNQSTSVKYTIIKRLNK